MIAHEKAARAKLEDLAKKERATLISEGMKFYNAPNSNAYLKLARGLGLRAHDGPPQEGRT